MCATAAERSAFLRGAATSPHRIGPYDGLRAGRIVALVSGIGVGPAAGATATALALGDYEAVVSVGICGGFGGAAQLGDAVVATSLVAADLGADSPEEFLDLDALGWGPATAIPAALVEETQALLTAAGLPVVTGPVVTVSTVTGTEERAAQLAARHGPVAEAMEGRGVADAAAAFGVPALEVRTVSNLVGRRDLSAWRIDLALDRLAEVGAALLDADAWP